MIILGPVAIPRRDASADNAGGWLAGFAFLRSSSFCRANFLFERSDCRWNNADRVGEGRFAGVVFAGSAGASRCPFHCYTLIKKLHVRTS